MDGDPRRSPFESTPLSRAWLKSGGIQIAGIPLGLNQCGACRSQYITVGGREFFPSFCPYCGSRIAKTEIVEDDEMREQIEADESTGGDQ